MFSQKSSSSKIVLAIAAYSGASVLGPMLTFGIIGFFMDKNFGTAPKFLLINIGIAFIVSNVLLFRQRRNFAKKFSNKKSNKPNKLLDN